MARRLFMSARSPYARKVRIAMIEKGLAFEPVMVDLQSRSAEFVTLSPLGKIPVLVDEDGTLVFDSTVIAEYLEDRYPEPPVLGRSWSERLVNRAIEELGDTLADQAVAMFQARSRAEGGPEERARQIAKSALLELERRARSGAWPAEFGLGDAGVIAALGYLELRHGRGLLEAHPEVLRRAALHAGRPSVASTTPA
jgi:glutathione S-transferase